MKILFVHQGLISFIEKDLDILQKVHEVKSIEWKGGLGSIVRNLFYLWEGMVWCDLTFSWFGKLHAFFAVLFSKILRKKSIVVAGGDDVAYEPEIGYGMFSYWWKKWCPLFVFKYADSILAVSEYARAAVIQNGKAEAQKVKLIYHGFDLHSYEKVDQIEKKPVVMTVADLVRSHLIEKGLDLFMESAKYLPDIKFIVVGPFSKESNNYKYLKSFDISNVLFTGEIYGKELSKLFSEAKVYVQLSRHESFGCALAEAMLHMCIPVVTKKKAIPEVVGNCGYYVEDDDTQKIAEVIKKALLDESDLCIRARKRIQALFPLEKRKEQLLRLIEEIGKSR